MRIGESHRDVAIILVGALSRFVNNLEEDDLRNPQTKNLLKALSKIHRSLPFIN